MVTKRDTPLTRPGEVSRTTSFLPLENATQRLGSPDELLAAHTNLPIESGSPNVDGESDDVSDWNRFGAHEMPAGLREKLIHAKLPLVPADQLFDTVPPNGGAVAPGSEETQPAQTGPMPNVESPAAELHRTNARNAKTIPPRTSRRPSAPPVRGSTSTDALPLQSIVSPNARRALISVAVVVAAIWTIVAGRRWLAKTTEQEVALEAAAPADPLAAPTAPVLAPLAARAAVEMPAQLSNSVRPPDPTHPSIELRGPGSSSAPTRAERTKSAARPAAPAAPLPPTAADSVTDQRPSVSEPIPKPGSALDSKALPRLE